MARPKLPRLVYDGPNEVEVRGVKFPPGRPVIVRDPDLRAKMLAWPDVREVGANDEDPA